MTFKLGFFVVGVCLSMCVVPLVRADGRFDRYQVLRIYPKDNEDINSIERLKRFYGAQLDFWKSPYALEQPVDIMIPPDLTDDIDDSLKMANINYDVMIDDVQSLIDHQVGRRSEAADHPPDQFEFDRYHTYEEIETWMLESADKHEEIVQVFKIATSFEKREIQAFKIAKDDVVTGKHKPTVFLVGGFHAREWISPATLIFMAHELFSKYGADSDITRLVDEIVWFIVPVANVDGYMYTWASDGDRMWRKTRSINEDANCTGTDPNRNWDMEWGGPGTSDNPCSDIYHGSRPFSEREVREIADFIKTHDVDVYLDYHAYGQLWLSRWSYTYEEPGDKTDDNIETLATMAIKSVHGREYEPGKISHMFGRITGVSVDWVYSSGGVSYAFAIELRDSLRSEYGFLLPEDQIIPTGEENFAAVKAIGFYVLNG